MSRALKQVDVSTEAGQAEMQRRERVQAKREVRELRHVRQRARVMFADGIPIEEIARRLQTYPCRVRAALETSARIRGANFEPQPALMPMFTTLGAVRRMIDPPPKYETVRAWLNRAGIPILALPADKGRAAMRVIPTAQLSAFLASCLERPGDKPTSTRERKLKRDRERQARLRAQGNAPLLPHDASAASAHERAAEHARFIQPSAAPRPISAEITPKPAPSIAPASPAPRGPARDAHAFGSGRFRGL